MSTKKSKRAEFDNVVSDKGTGSIASIVFQKNGYIRISHVSLVKRSRKPKK